MTINFSKSLLLGVLAVGLAGWQPANAGFAIENSVTLGNQTLFQMADAAGVSGNHRAWQAQDALDNALFVSTDRSPSAVTIVREHGAITIALGGHKIATVDSGSAQQAGLSADALAEKWAQSIKDFLSDANRTAAYVATLKNDHMVKADIVMTERTMYAPAGMSFQVKLTNALSLKTARVGDIVEATIDQDVAMGHYVIPAGSVVTGKLFDSGNDNFNIHFLSITAASGKVFPITGIVTESSVIASNGPHRVCTYVIPSGMANGVPLVAGRIPAGIGIGTQFGSGSNILVFERNSTELYGVGKVLHLQLEDAAPVAVSMRLMTM